MKNRRFFKPVVCASADSLGTNCLNRKGMVITMPKQNIFDDEIFFEGYKKLCENRYSANEIDEKPI